MEVPQPETVEHEHLPQPQIVPPHPHKALVPFLPNEGELQNFYDSLVPFVWVLNLGYEYKRQAMQKYLTAFAVGDGMLMTCAHGDWDSLPKLQLTGKRLFEDKEKCYKIEIVKKQSNCDMCLLKVNETVKNMTYPRFGSGNVEAGETVLVVGHPLDYVGSGLYGTNTFKCVEDTHFQLTDKLTCNHHSPKGMKNPKHRVMGHVFNIPAFKRFDEDPKDDYNYHFEKKLLARLPIIQAKGIVAGKGASGAPMFNLKGEVIGMHVYGMDGFDISIHSAALKAFVDWFNEASSKKRKAQ